MAIRNPEKTVGNPGFTLHEEKRSIRSSTSTERPESLTNKLVIRTAADVSSRGNPSKNLEAIDYSWIVVHPLPHNGFRYSFTLSPKCFSSFAHATCALSVFPSYLALAEVYLPFAMHSQALLLRESKGIVSRRGRKTGLSPSRALHSWKTFPTCGNTRNSLLHNSDVIRFGLGLSLFARRY